MWLRVYTPCVLDCLFDRKVSFLSGGRGGEEFKQGVRQMRALNWGRKARVRSCCLFLRATNLDHVHEKNALCIAFFAHAHLVQGLGMAHGVLSTDAA